MTLKVKLHQIKCIEVIYYCAEKLGVKLMVIDSLMKCGINEDDLNTKTFCK